MATPVKTSRENCYPDSSNDLAADRQIGVAFSSFWALQALFVR
jgi:hypothetical protein